MVKAAERTIWVKGDPEQKVLGDCPFCHRALLTLELKGLAYDREYIEFSKKPEWLFEKTEKGTVPVLKDGERWVPDSGDIVTYLGTEYPEPDIGPVGMPDDIGAEFFSAFVQFLKDSASKERDPEKEKNFLAQLQELDDFLGQSGQPFFNGAEMGGADCFIVPRLYHASVALPKLANWPFPWEKYKHIKTYMETVKKTDAFKKTKYGEDLIVKGWKPKVQQ